ncbi:uncharacterized protein FFUJ_03830 [Fusarium fujikuroi IMI 58289]|uniref:Uncharacterized protein n=1 Tax=Gibberella fujikuroi (strain CBS 195.34 / IMI 58289 / NRRL A-6831) TaxID=1279085 RepID=S0DWP1_GIBF5|nr:uncharacterized protein FFUJ_03830 [Fusarium fujikuroi IMI 58289]KLP21780.1 uncharacterized protein LW94_4080 [Fusarium fujikuroi]QGI92127.1 hypothetical protein CEK26_005196 [Fusarium fujikuroi]CCT64908.1 uncharacterized protein FFUJ_03830 [Fusarium fujikuroi IMI 58289]SCN90009.1 uncharacterized protein FFM5_04852 [Fusarium fujikuroi]SCO36243.1 uncharacterized protein FFMR_03999 [Fusarium fujikuroi]
MSTPDQPMKQQEDKKSHDSAMLQVWLNEPEDVVSATDTWSSQRAFAKPRCHLDFEEPKRPKNKDTGIASAT